MIRNRLSRARNSFDSDDINPMEGVANLSDAMLVLAVGIMLSLIIAWNVDIGSVGNDSSANNAVQVEDGETLSEGDDGKSAEDYGLTEAGKLYKDADGNYYMVEE